MAEKTLARATIRNARIESVDGNFWPKLRVAQWKGLVNPSIPVRRRAYNKENLVGKCVDIRIRHLLLDYGTEDERVVWEARVLGDIK
jgi:hypothetical protein